MKKSIGYYYHVRLFIKLPTSGYRQLPIERGYLYVVTRALVFGSPIAAIPHDVFPVTVTVEQRSPPRSPSENNKNMRSIIFREASRCHRILSQK